MNPDAILDQDDVPLDAIELELWKPRVDDRENFSEWSSEKTSNKLDNLIEGLEIKKYIPSNT